MVAIYTVFSVLLLGSYFLSTAAVIVSVSGTVIFRVTRFQYFLIVGVYYLINVLAATIANSQEVSVTYLCSGCSLGNCLPNKFSVGITEFAVSWVISRDFSTSILPVVIICVSFICECHVVFITTIF